MKFFILLSVVLTPAQFLLITERPTADKVTTEDENNSVQDKIFTVPTGKCRELSALNQKSEQEACDDHCNDLKEFSGGDCVDEICRCRLNVNNVIQSIDGKTRNEGKRGTAGRKKARKGVKCKNLIRFGGSTASENHRGCAVHCKLLDSENKGGQCVQGVCQCTKEVPEKKPKREEEDAEEEEDEQEQCASDDMCLIRCRGMNKEFNTGVCKDGTCHCGTAPDRHGQIPELKSREVVKCEHRRKSVNDEKCKSHCESFSKDHVHGRCVAGICRCGYAVFEMLDPEKEEKNGKGTRTKTPEDGNGELKRVRSRGRHQLLYNS